VSDHLTEEEAARLWQRAAALQAEAAHLAEVGSGEEEDDAGDARAGDDERDSGYAIEHVRAAALEAGIGAEYLDAALVDLKAERALPNARNRGVIAERVFPDLPGAITVKRVIEATPNEVLDAMEKVFPEEPYQLSLLDQKGDVLEGGVLVFDIVGASMFESEGFKGKVSASDLRQIYVSIHSLDGGRRCEVTLRGPVAWAETRNTGIGAVVIALMGGGGLAVGGGAGGALAAAMATAGLVSISVSGVIAAGLAVAGLLGGGGAGTVGFRAMYRYSLRLGEKALEGLLSAVAVRAQGGWGLGRGDTESIPASPEPPRLSP